MEKSDIEQIELVTAALSGDIYMAEIEKNGTMNVETRKLATEDVLRAAAEWFISNKETEINFDGHGKLKWVAETEEETK